MQNQAQTNRWTPRSTVAAIIEDAGRFLMVEERVHGKLMLNQPAGHMEEGESFAAGMLREVFEETGYQAEPEALLGLYVYRTPDGLLTFHRVCFIARVLRQIPDAKLDEGIVRTLWMTRDEVASADNLRAPLVLQCIDDYLAGKRYPLEFIQD